MCLIITRAPSSNLAGPALRELDRLHSGMEDASPTCKIAADNLVRYQTHKIIGTAKHPAFFIKVFVKKLCDQAHEAMHKLQPQAGALMELDRLSGQTQLVATEPQPRPTPALQTVTPPPLLDFRPSPSVFESMAELWSLENLHPTIMDDWKTFEGFTADSTIPPPAMFDEPSQSSSASNDVQMVYAPDLSWSRNGEIYSQHEGFDLGGMNGGVGAAAGSAGPLTLDPTWQNFVEQLGF